MPENMTLGQWMKAEMTSKNLSLTQCSEKSGMTVSEWSRWLKDISRRQGGKTSMPSVDTMMAIAKGLDVHLFEVVAVVAKLPLTQLSEEDLLAHRIAEKLKRLPAPLKRRAGQLLSDDADKYVSLLTA